MKKKRAISTLSAVLPNSGVRRRKRLPDDRVAEILDVAAEVFIAEGFATASINTIASLANASKTTFYSRFSTKEDLFLAVIERRMNRIFEQVATFPEDADLARSLTQFGANLLRIALSTEQVALIRMVSMESARYPELAAHFYDNGPKRGEDALARYLAIHIKAGSLRDEDPLIMAGQLMSLLTGSTIRWFVLGFSAKHPSKMTLEHHVDSVVNLFLRAYRIPTDRGNAIVAGA